MIKLLKIGNLYKLISSLLITILLFFILGSAYASTVVFYDDFNSYHKEEWFETVFNGSWYLESDNYVGTASPEDISNQRLNYTRAGNINWNNYTLEGNIYGQDSVDKTIIPRFGSDGRLYYITFRSPYSSDGNDILLFKFSDINYTNWEILQDRNYNNNPNTWYSFKVQFIDKFEENNKSTEIIVFIDNHEVIRVLDKNNPIMNGNIALAVWPEGTQTIRFDNIKVSLNQQIQPPTSKVIIAPGMGASWNADALINCKHEDYEGDWTLAPYASNYYTPLVDTLNQSGYETIIFNYDWRAQIPQNAPPLETAINDFTEENEKVHFVGHSMGGLVGRAYLENTTNESNKIDKYLSAGSPHQGVVQAYPAWAGGQIQQNNLFLKIAQTLLLRRCGLVRNSKQLIQNHLPSIQNLLPTFDYLRIIRENQFFPVTEMVNQNNWLTNYPDTSVFDSHGSSVETLSGSGYQTPEILNSLGPNRSFLRRNLWEDGYPVRTISSTEGDGTVLNRSSQITGVNNRSVNEKHANLVAVPAGLTEIMDYLGPLAETVSTTSFPPFSEPETSLVVISHPSDFAITDPYGQITPDRDDIIALKNPQQGRYYLNVNPQSDNTELIVIQLLKSDRVLYREYHFRGRQPFSRSLNFNPLFPKENVLE